MNAVLLVAFWWGSATVVSLALWFLLKGVAQERFRREDRPDTETGVEAEALAVIRETSARVGWLYEPPTAKHRER